MHAALAGVQVVLEEGRRYSGVCRFQHFLCAFLPRLSLVRRCFASPAPPCQPATTAPGSASCVFGEARLQCMSLCGGQRVPSPHVQHADLTPPAGAGLHCPRCGYDLRGSPELRCPECGSQWTRADVGSSDPWLPRERLFEYAWRRRPVASFLFTMWALLRPWRFWRSLARIEPPRLLPLCLLLLACISLTVLCYWATEWGTHVVYSAAASRAYGTGDFGAYTSAVPQFTRELVVAAIWAVLCWSWLLAWLYLFKAPIPRHPAAAARVAGYVLVLIVIARLVVELLLSGLLVALLSLGPPLKSNRFWEYAERTGQVYEWLIASIPLIAALWLCVGASLYLRLRHGWLIGFVASMLATATALGFLLLVCLWDAGTADNVWTRAADTWAPGAQTLVRRIIMQAWPYQ